MNKKTAIISTISLVFLCAAASHHASADASNIHVHQAPQFAVTVSDMMMLVRQQHQPAACRSGLDGELAMTNKAQVCICDAQNKQWRSMGTGSVCAW